MALTPATLDNCGMALYSLSLSCLCLQQLKISFYWTWQ